MGQAVATGRSHIKATDTHIVMIPSPGGEIPTPMPFQFDGILCDDLSTDVFAGGAALAMQGSGAHNLSPHIPDKGRFLKNPSNRGTVALGSRNVYVNGKPVARDGDIATTCNDPVEQPVGRVEARSDTRVFAGS